MDFLLKEYQKIAYLDAQEHIRERNKHLYLYLYIIQ